MNFDLSCFTDFGSWLFATIKQVYESLNFDFGGYTLNGLAIIVGIVLFTLVIYGIGRLLE